MKTKRRIRIAVLGILIIIVLIIGIGISLSVNKASTVHATEITTNPTFNVNEVRIDGWRAIKDMTTFGDNIDNGCGMTAMAILLQYYNDNSRFAGEILPNDLDNNFDSGVGKNNINANALRGYSLSDAPPGYTTERDDDLFRLTPRIVGPIIGGWFDAKNATVAGNHKTGLEKFFEIHCPNLNINVYANGNANGAKEQIDNNRPILLTMLSYDNDLPDGNGDKKDGKAHVVVAYGYREVNGKIEFLAHSGWYAGETRGKEVWFSPHGNTTFIDGFAYIDAPLDRFNTTVISGSAVRIDGLKRNATGNLIIPSYLNGLPVTEIGNNAFSGQTGVTSVTFANGSNVKTIGSSAFSGMTGLTKITLPSSLTTIGNNAFFGCTALPQIQIPSYVTSIGSSAFANCPNIAGIAFEDSGNLTSVLDHAASAGYYSRNYSEEKPLNVGLVAGVTYTLSFDYIFINGTPSNSNVWTRLGIGETEYEADLPVSKLFFNGVSEGRQVVKFTPNISDLELSNKLWVRFFWTETQQDVCGWIKNIRLEYDSQLKTIGSNAFSECTGLSQISIPSNITSIGSNAFSINTKVDWEEHYSFKGSEFSGILGGQTNFTIPSKIAGRTITSISDNAFKNCTSLTALTIPASITTIGSGAFAGCISLTAFAVDSSNSNYISIDGVLYSKSPNGNIGATLIAYPAGKAETNFTLPDSVTKIAPYAFNDCVNLGKVIFSVDRFVYCGFESFDLNSSLKIIIPYDLRSAYQSNADWSHYINNFETPNNLVTFSENGGSAVSSKTISYGEYIYLDKPEKSGFTFAGWYDDDGYCYYLYTLWNSLDNEVTLYAAWANKTYTVNLSEIQVTYEILYTTYNIELPGAKIPTKQACDYIGYNIDGGEEIPYYFKSGLGAELWNLEDTVLYEDWRLTIDFYSEGGVIGTENAKPGTVIHNITFIPTRRGFTFIGWSTEPYGNGAEFNKFTAYFNVQFYAKWECIIAFSVTNGEDLILNCTNVPANIIWFTYTIETSNFIMIGPHSLLDNLSSSGNYNSPKNITITFKTICVNESGEETNYSLNDKSLTFYNLFAGGSGTSSSPYLISCSRHFDNIRKSTSSYYKLINDISLYGSNWTSMPAFSGTLDGNYCRLSGLYINSSAAGKYGLFTEITSLGTVKNLTITAIDINISGATGGTVYVGAFAGTNSGKIDYCKAEIPPSYPDWFYNTYSYIYCYRVDSYMGGIAGANYGTISDCNSVASLSGCGNIGGIAGSNSGTVKSCQSSSNIYYLFSSLITTVANNKSIGGIVGLQTGGETKDCTFSGYISSYINGGNSNIFQPRMGQIIGQRQGGTYFYNSVYYNPLQGKVDISNLSGSQALYAKNTHIGKE